MKTQSAKSKGRRLQQYVCEKLHTLFPTLQKGDIESCSMGSSGIDVKLSPAARALFPYSIECKNQESLNVWGSFKQAESNCMDGTKPLLVFKRNRTEVYCMLKLDDFLELYNKD